MGFAVRKDWPILQGIVDKGIASISTQEREEIYQRWNGQNLFEESWLQKNKTWLALATLCFLGFILMRLYMWDKTIQARILNRFSTNWVPALRRGAPATWMTPKICASYSAAA